MNWEELTEFMWEVVGPIVAIAFGVVAVLAAIGLGVAVIIMMVRWALGY